MEEIFQSDETGGGQESKLAVILTTVGNEAAADRLATGLLAARLAACVQVDAAVTSHYRWEGESHRDHELRVVIKTREDRVAEVGRWLSEHHPYDVPQIIALPVSYAGKAYARWVSDSVGEGRRR